MINIFNKLIHTVENWRHLLFTICTKWSFINTLCFLTPKSASDLDVAILNKSRHAFIGCSSFDLVRSFIRWKSA